MKNPSKNPFIPIVCCFTAGISIAHLWVQTDVLWWSACLSITIAGLLVLLNLHYKGYAYRLKTTIGILTYLLFTLLGIIRMLQHREIIHPNHFSKHPAKYLLIKVAEEPQEKPRVIRFRAQVSINGTATGIRNTSGHLMVSLGKPQSIRVSYGDTLLVPATYQSIPGPQHAAQFNYRSWLAAKNVHHQIYLNPSVEIHHRPNRSTSLRSYALALRKRQVDLLRGSIKNNEAFSVASALLLGYRSDLDEETFSAYSKTGTIHVLSVSGMHVGIIFVALQYLLSHLDRRMGLRLLKLGLILIAVWFYSLLTGLSPSVLRSTIMLSCLVVAKTLQLRSNGFNILAFSAFILLLADPSYLLDVGFQLSYLAVWGLMYIQPLLYRQIAFENVVAGQLWKATTISLAAQWATLPLSIYYFHQFPIYFIFTNLLIIIPAALIMYIGFAMLLVKAPFLGMALEQLIIFTNKGLSWFANLPYASWSALWLNGVQALLLAATCLSLLLILTHLTKKGLFFCLCVFLLLQLSFTVERHQLARQNGAIRFTVNGERIWAYLYRKHAFVYLHNEASLKAYHRNIKPYLEMHKIMTLELKFANGDIKKMKHL